MPAASTPTCCAIRRGAGGAPHVYVCGPTALVETVGLVRCVELGHAPARIRTERSADVGPQNERVTSRLRGRVTRG